MRLWSKLDALCVLGASVNIDVEWPATELKMVNDVGDEVVLAGNFDIVVSDGTNTLAAGSIAVADTLVLSTLPKP